MKHSVSTSQDVTCNVTNSNNERFKIYEHQTPFAQKENVIYLNDGQEFKIELKNNLTERIAAKIYINNKDIGNMLILRPGERIYLERFLDDAKKFVFQTYKVDGDKQTIESTENNGEVKIQYFKERKTYPTYYNTYVLNEPCYPKPSPSIWYSNSSNTNIGQNISCTTSNFSPNSLKKTLSRSKSSITPQSFDSNVTYSSNVSMDNLSFADMNMERSKDFETGRIEKGAHSDQQFKTVEFDPEYYPFETVLMRLMAVSNKPTYVTDIKTYCTECGARRRKDSHKFCPHCGTSY